MSNWTPERRLEIIKALAGQALPRLGKERDLLIRIMFMCDMPDVFLEANKGNYEDAIKLADAELTITL